MNEGWQFQALQTPLLVIVFCLVVLVFTGVLSFLNWKRRGGGSVAALEILRFVIVALILFTLCKPEFVRTTTSDKQPEVVILKDVSNSTTTRDVVAENEVIRRGELLDQILDKTTAPELWSGIEGKAKVTIADFGMSGTTDTNLFKTGTDINNALEDQRKKNKNLKAVFLLSDGDWNFGEPPQQAAMKLGAEKIPVFTLTVGRDRAQPDVIVESVNPPNYGLLGQQIAIPFRIVSYLDEEYTTAVTLSSSRGPRVSISKTVTIPARGQEHDSIVWRPTEIADYTLSVSVPTWIKGSEKELIEDNNQQTFQLAIRTEKLNVLVVESYPRWEYRYLRNALTRDPGVDVSVLLLHPELGPGAGLNYIQKFPETREQLAKFDVVFLGDVGIGDKELTAEQANQIRGLVDQQGSGLVFMPGIRGRQLTFADHPLGELIPVTYDTSEKEGYWAQREVNFKLTSTGKGHFLTMLASDEFLNDNIWKNLPGFYWCAAVERARPGSQVLATHSSKRNDTGYIPVLATRPWGGGEVLFMGTDAAWRWRRGVEDRYHYRFWGQVVRWMAHKRKMAQGEGVRLTYSPPNPKEGDEVFLQATLLDLSGSSLNSSLRASVKDPNGQTRDITFKSLEGDWGVFQEKMNVGQPGTYSIEVYNPNGKQSVKTEIFVEGWLREKLGQPANSKVMQEIAQRTGGQSGGADDFKKLLSQITLVAENEVFTENFRLWDKWWWGAIILLLLAVYWVCRKVMGLI